VGRWPAVSTSGVRDSLIGLRSVLLRRSLNVLWLALVTAESIPELHLRDSPRGLADLSLLVVAALAWLYALVIRIDRMTTTRLISLIAMTLAGGAMVPSAPLPLVFPGVAMMTVALRWPLTISGALTVCGLLATLIANIDEPHVLANILGMLAVSLGGTTVGNARFQSVEAERRAAAVTLEAARADLEHERAELLAQRNHLAREIHDVLAHTLSALSVQLEALSAVIDHDDAPNEQLSALLDRAKRLVREGIGEVRGAIETLRDDPTPLDERLAKLAADRGSAFSLRGTPRSLDPKTSIAIYRAVQEALTNAIKHAPGSPIAVDLAFEADTVSATIENPLGEASHDTADNRHGYGLVGMRERVAELGGSVDAGQSEDVWRVVVRVPIQA
jgi:signal transduction histidine kinase